MAFSFSDALLIAIEGHRGQKDLGGHEYIKHPLHVAYLLKIRGATEATQIVGLLHDVLEDSELTETDLISRGVPDDIMDALRLLNHDNKSPDSVAFIQEKKAEFMAKGVPERFANIRAKEEEYFRYGRRLSINGMAADVKIADIDHNSDISRVPMKDMETFESREYIGRRNMKYAILRRMLTGGRVL